MHGFRDMTTYWSKIAKKTNPPHLARSFGVTLANFSTGHTFPETSHGAIRWYTFHDPAFALLGTIPACDGQTDRRTDGHVAVAKTRYSIYAVARKN